MKVLLVIVAVVVVTPIAALGVLFALSRPVDTTEARVFAGDGRALDYCDLPELSGRGSSADDIPVAYTPGCGWEGEWPMPVLADCTEPLGPGVADLRGLWQGTTGAVGHVERIEQCGDRVIVTSSGIIHDMRADGTLAHGANDVGARCMRIFAAAGWVDGALTLRPFGQGLVTVTRRLEGDEVVWEYPAIGTTRMRRICSVPGPRPEGEAAAS